MSAPLSWPLDRVLARLGLERDLRVNLESLARAYRAWSRNVPFTNLDKLTAVRTGAPLPSLEPAAIFARFLENGSCGTCFSHAVAFRALLEALGFEARNYVGHTLGADGVTGQHATTIVTLNEDELWLVDTALPHGEPLRIHRDRPTKIDGVMTPMVVHPEGTLWRMDCLILHNKDRRQVYLQEPVRDVSHATQRWQLTLTEKDSPFNKLPVARLELPSACLTLAGSKLFTVSFGGDVSVEPAGPNTLARFGVEPGEYAALWSR
jgi:arylamine N-acetyltransferase